MDECESKPEINQTVGDEYELGIECWNCGYKWIIFRHVAQQDGSAKCPQCGMWNKRALQQALADTEIIEGYLNSPQFKKEYAKREELVEEIEKERKEIDLKADDDVIIPLLETMDIVLEIIRKHGLEE